jgi:hypothetical protein
MEMCSFERRSLTKILGAATVGGWPASGLVRSLVGAGGRIGLRRSATRAAVGQRYGWGPGLERGPVFFSNSRVLSGDKLRGFGGGPPRQAWITNRPGPGRDPFIAPLAR